METLSQEIAIEFESIHTIEYELDYMLKKNNLVLPSGTNSIQLARRLVKIHFLAAWDELSPLTQSFNKTIKLVIHYEAKDSAKGVLAYFNTGKSHEQNASVMYFGIYLNTVYSYIASFLQNNPLIPINDGVWQHEIIHMLDFAKLDSRNEMFKYDLDEYKRMDAFVYSKLDYAISDSTPPHWLFLNSLADFRDEGIPRLYEYMRGYSKPEIEQLEKAIEYFKLYYGRLKYYLLKNSLTAFELTEFNQFLEEFQRISYAIGPWFVLNALCHMPQGFSKSEAKELTQAIQAKEIINQEQSLAILQKALSLDLGAYLILNADELFEPTDNFFFDADDLLTVAGLLSKEYKDNEPHEHFVRSINAALESKDEPKFITLLSDVMGFAMSSEEILAAYEEFKTGLDTSFYITSKILVKVNGLMQEWKEDQNELLALVLTYVFDPSDILDDSINLIGYIDDFYVIHAYELLSDKRIIDI